LVEEVVVERGRRWEGLNIDYDAVV